MIARYSRPAMQKIWTDENKFNAFLQVELLACKAWSEINVIPKADVEKLEKNAKFEIGRAHV